MPARDSRAQMRRFLVLFPACLLVGFALLQVPGIDTAVALFTRSLVGVTGAVIHLFGGRAIVYGDVLQSPTGGMGVKVENGCNAINVTILLWAAILTYPAGWRHKLRGVLLGSLALHTVNLARIISLYYLEQYNRRWFDFAHFYLWESLIVLDTLVIFWIWAAFVRRRRGEPDAAAA